jgi:hypothetical protein
MLYQPKQPRADHACLTAYSSSDNIVATLSEPKGYSSQCFLDRYYTICSRELAEVEGVGC